jgi:hypothetical protein
MPNINIDDKHQPEYPAHTELGLEAMRAGYGVYYNSDLIGIIDLDATNNWCAYPLDKEPLLWPEHVFADEWDAAVTMVRRLENKCQD